MTFLRSILLLLLLAVVSPPLWGQKKPAPPETKKPAAIAASPGLRAPLPATAKPSSSHAPYEAGDCGICHRGTDSKQPGPLTKPVPELCLDCHEEFVAVLKRPHTHAPARSACTACHNPHNAKQPKLLVEERLALCTSCHANIKAISATAKVKHGALSVGTQCTNCHNPHGSSVDRLLIALPFDLCVNCHNQDALADVNGKKLLNMKAWLETNPVWHGPVTAKDCSACHQPHGANQFRLLKEYYPPEFYAPYDARNYALCFSCHEERTFSTAETTTLTNFRNGAKNLHFVHLQQGSRGRTCRACHEVHASRQEHHIREGVPYGSAGWILKLNYKKTGSGGSCEKTCHQERSYSNRTSR
jgi:predicted CXXCH cytochrome family protein